MRNTMEETREEQIYGMLDNLAATLNGAKEKRVLAVPTAVGLRMYGDPKADTTYDNTLKAVQMFMQPDQGEAVIPVYGTQTFSSAQEMTDDEQYAVSTPWATNLGRAVITGGYFTDEGETPTERALDAIAGIPGSVLYTVRDIVSGEIFREYAPKAKEAAINAGSALLNALYKDEIATTEEQLHDEELRKRGFLNGQGSAYSDGDWFITLK